MAVPRRTLTLLRKLGNQVGVTADDTVRAIAAAWVHTWDGLSPAWQQAITAILDHYQRTGQWPAPWQTARIEAIARAQHQTQAALTVLLTEAANTTRSAVAHISEATVKAEPHIITSQLRQHTRIVVPAAAVESALTSRQHRITALHTPILGVLGDTTRRVFTRPPASLNDPKRAGKDLYNQARAGFDSGITRAVTIARTETVDTYRTASSLVHAANRHVVTGWAWYCSCDLRSCPACWVMHGRQFLTDVPGPQGHPSCRCTRLPVTTGIALPTAEARFRRMSRRDQTAVLGPARWSLWRSGRIGWTDLAAQRTNPGWRPSYTPRPVRDLELLAAQRAA